MVSFSEFFYHFPSFCVDRSAYFMTAFQKTFNKCESTTLRLSLDIALHPSRFFFTACLLKETY